MKILKGNIGYIDFYKKKYLKSTILSFITVIIFYLIGKLFLQKYFVFFALISALLILPVSQQLSRFIIFAKYKSASKYYYEQLKEINEHWIVLADLIVVNKKTTLFFDFIVITDQVIIGCYKSNKKDAAKVLEDIYKQSGYNYPIAILESEEEILKHKTPGLNNNSESFDEKIQEKLAMIILQNSI